MRDSTGAPRLYPPDETNPGNGSSTKFQPFPGAFNETEIAVGVDASSASVRWATMIGGLLFDEAVDAYVFIGGGIIVATACFASHRDLVETKAKTSRSKI